MNNIQKIMDIMNQIEYGFLDDNGNNNYTMTFANQLSAGTKTPAIKVEDANGNTAIKAYDLTVTS